MKISVITINYNNCEGLRKTIDSVVNQTWRDFEYIIIDGGSTDGSVDVIKQYADRIDYWVSEPDKGIYNAMNKGIDVAKGEYCIFINSGDSFYDSHSLESSSCHIYDSDIVSGAVICSDGRKYVAPKVISLGYLYLEAISHQSTFIKTCWLKKYKYSENYRIASDYRFWLQTLIVENCTYQAIDVDVAIFDVAGISSTNSKLLLEERKTIQHEILSERLLLDLEGVENEFYHELKRRRYHKHFYKLNVLLIRLLSVFKGKGYWINKYPIDI